MNWQAQIEFFHTLTEEDLTMFAPPREVVRAAASYNYALEALLAGRREQAMKNLEQISNDYPMFVQAGHLYGITLAADNRFLDAETQLRRVSILDVPEQEAQQLAAELKEVIRESSKIRREKAYQARREEVLMPIKADQALHGILQKANFDRKRPRWRQGQELNEQSVEAALVFSEEVELEKAKTIRLTIFAIVIALALILLFFLILRPNIINRQKQEMERAKRLEWLEQELIKRAPQDLSLANFLSDYQNYVSAPNLTTETTTEDVHAETIANSEGDTATQTEASVSESPSQAADSSESAQAAEETKE